MLRKRRNGNEVIGLVVQIPGSNKENEKDIEVGRTLE